MREISIYEIKSTFVMGSSNDLIELYKKLNIDKSTLDEITRDFNKDKINYKEEYYKAKHNYLVNLYLYNYLIIKKYFEDAVLNDFDIYPDYTKVKMKKDGWMFPHSLINSRISSYSPNESPEEVYIRYFDTYFDKLFNFDIGQLDSRVNRYYKQAINCYKNTNYYSCVVSLFPIIESYHQAINNFDKDEFYRVTQNLDKVSNKIKNVNQPFVSKINYYVKLVDQFNDLAKNHYFNNSTKRMNEPKIINRNRIMHGLFSREVSKEDCLQLFCVISNLVDIKELIDANDKMQKIKIELEELEISKNS